MRIQNSYGQEPTVKNLWSKNLWSKFGNINFFSPLKICQLSQKNPLDKSHPPFFLITKWQKISTK